MTTSLQHSSQALILDHTIILGRELARGGEGTIYAIKGNNQLVAKIFHRPNPEKAQKLKAMLANPPEDKTRHPPLNHISIAWPRDLIVDSQGQCRGFTMPYINPSKTFPLLKVYNPRDRLQTWPYFTWDHLLSMAHNLSITLNELHKKGYVVGDLNESNILVTDTGLVTLVDCDSFQVPKKESKRRGSGDEKEAYFLCTVGKPEYTPPEIQGQDFSQVKRTPNHDNFGLAVLIFLLLMEGRHPFSGAWHGEGRPPTIAQNIQARQFPYGYSTLLTPPKNALPFNTLPSDLQDLMRDCFSRRRWSFLFWQRQRPNASRWMGTFMGIREGEMLRTCTKNSQHWYSDHLRYCPWCKRVEQLHIPDPFPPLPANYVMPNPNPPAPRSRKRLRRIPGRIFRRVPQQLIKGVLILLTAALYALEIRFWPFYEPFYLRLISHATRSTQLLLWLLLLFFLIMLPLVVYQVLKSRFKVR